MRLLAPELTLERRNRAALEGALDRFCCASLPRGEAVAAIDRVASLLAQSTPELARADIVVPVLRAGLAMFASVDAAAGYVDTAFAVYRRTNAGAVGTWTPARTFPDARHAVVVDVIAASGGTVEQVLRDLPTYAPSVQRISLLLCFATPQALARVALASRIPVDATVGRLCQGVDPNGYVIPPTHGDAGEKLYAANPSATASTSPAS
jgi:uracil phosphoribosyltransferase